jgi:hypothetical protein
MIIRENKNHEGHDLVLNSGDKKLQLIKQTSLGFPVHYDGVDDYLNMVDPWGEAVQRDCKNQAIIIGKVDDETMARITRNKQTERNLAKEKKETWISTQAAKAVDKKGHIKNNSGSVSFGQVKKTTLGSIFNGMTK